MKANELMRNDWVCLENDNTPRQVDWIRSGEVGLFWNQIVTPPYLKPIPLTGEMLEKNGFKARGGHWEYRNNYCSIKLYIAPKIEIEGEIFDEPPILLKVDGATFNLNIIVVYVHELQHALRLCGIEIEIKL